MTDHTGHHPSPLEQAHDDYLAGRITEAEFDAILAESDIETVVRLLTRELPAAMADAQDRLVANLVAVVETAQWLREVLGVGEGDG